MRGVLRRGRSSIEVLKLLLTDGAVWCTGILRRVADSLLPDRAAWHVREDRLTVHLLGLLSLRVLRLRLLPKGRVPLRRVLFASLVLEVVVHVNRIAC